MSELGQSATTAVSPGVPSTAQMGSRECVFTVRMVRMALILTPGSPVCRGAQEPANLLPERNILLGPLIVFFGVLAIVNRVVGNPVVTRTGITIVREVPPCVRPCAGRRIAHQSEESCPETPVSASDSFGSSSSGADSSRSI